MQYTNLFYNSRTHSILGRKLPQETYTLMKQKVKMAADESAENSFRNIYDIVEAN